MQLLNCPFCGGTAVECDGEWGHDMRVITIQCDCCLARARTASYPLASERGKTSAYESAIAAWNRRSPPPAVEGGWRFKRGAYVRKVVGSKWNGRVVGFYTTELTQRGYAVESMYEIGSVQIYPEKALELFSVAPTPPAGEKS